jgi:multicomponent Na+:H+ antiporter subunit A
MSTNDGHSTDRHTDQSMSSTMTRSLIMDMAGRGIAPLVLLLSLYVAFRGHNAPGGGFAGGLIAACAFALRFLGGGEDRDRRAVPIDPPLLIGLGLFLAALTAVIPLGFGDDFLESAIWKLDVALIGEVKIVSSMFFDIGVYLLVVGVVLMVIADLGTDAESLAGGEQQ